MKLNRLGSAVLSCVITLLIGYSTADAATFTVNKFDDTNDFSCDAVDCSLREAIIAANSTSGLDEIILPSGTYTLNPTGTGENDSLYGDLDITDDLNIFGVGSTRTHVDGNNSDRVFHIAPEGQDIFVSLFGISIQNGKTPNIAATAEEAAGGGILNKGLLSLVDVHIKSNEAAFTGTGGGLHNLGSIAMFRCEVSSNTASKGGGIYNDGSMEILTSTVNANTTTFVVFDSSGGGIFNQGALSVEDSTIFDNIASGLDGGGIYNNNLLSLTNATVDNNTVTYGDGGGIYNAQEVVLSNVTITNNDSPGGFGGGILNDGIVNIANSLLASNTAVDFASNCFPGEGKVRGEGIITHGYNLEDFDSCNFHDLGDQFNTDPLLLPRGINGGFTPTVGIQATSPAVDSGNPEGCSDIVDGTPLPTDQRAFLRPVEGNLDGGEICDIGAFEYKSTRPAGANIAVRIDAVANQVLVGDTAIYQTTVFNLGPEAATGTQLVIELPESFNLSSIHASQGSCEIVPVPDLPLRNLNCSLETIPEGGAAIVSFSGWPDSVGEFTITASISSDQTDNVPENNSSSVTTTVPSEDSLQLTTPNGGELLHPGSHYEINWTAPEEASKFKLKYSVDNGANWTRIGVARNATSYDWIVPDVTMDQPDSLVKVIAFNTDGNNLGNDISDKTFTIAPQATTLIYPNGGEVLYGGTPVLLKWTSASEAVRYRIKLSLDNGKSWSFVDLVEGATQTLWSVPELADDYTSCLIKLTAFDASGQKLSVDVSDATFSILQPVQVTSPNGGETMSQGENVTIQWEALPTATKFEVAYSINNGGEWTLIDTIENEHELSWLVPSVSSTQLNCLVRVIAFDASDANLAEDRSDEPFTITGPIPAVVVTSPSRGEEIPYGEFVNISWEIKNLSTEIGQILLEYSIDKGRSWSVIRTLGPDEISYDWRPPPVATDVNTCKVKVTLLDPAGDVILKDKSEETFSLLKASGDPWNYFPFEQGSLWNYTVTEVENGIQVGTYPMRLELTGTKLRLGVTTTIFRSFAQGLTNDNYLFKDESSITNYGNNIPGDAVTAQLVPYQEGRFPLIQGGSFVQIDKKGVNLGEDLDFDGKNERVDIKSIVSVKKYMEVTVPAGTFQDCALIKTNMTMTLTLSSNGQQATAIGNGSIWAAPGVGPVKRRLKTTIKFDGRKDVSVSTEALINYSIPLPPS
jgi:CSLREA domain-containing protein